tara:strand:+ start:4768 stop:5784 length:1017 start_codon:yes stop_codon:yes gene_type:complete
MKILHVSLHQGCRNDLNYVLDALGHEHEFFTVSEPDAQHYNVTADRADKYWHKHKDYFNTFDCIITSDTAPLCRIFLQNNWPKKLIIWIVNRFDYSHQPCKEFPDPEYYNLIKLAAHKNNVFIIPNTAIEFVHLARHGIHLENSGRNKIIKPIGLAPDNAPAGKHSDINDPGAVTLLPDKAETFFVPRYHNETLFMNLSKTLGDLGIKNYNERHKGFADLKEFKGVISIPYAYQLWSLMEYLALNIVLFIPSKNFLTQLAHQGGPFWHQNMEYFHSHLELSEFYNTENSKSIIYFDSWEDLVEKTRTLDYNRHQLQMSKNGRIHTQNTLRAWEAILSQ